MLNAKCRHPTATQLSKYDSTHSLTFNRRPSPGSNRTPKVLSAVFVQLTFPRPQTLGSVSSANETSPGKPEATSCAHFKDIPPLLTSTLLASNWRWFDPANTETCVITGTRA